MVQRTGKTKSVARGFVLLILGVFIFGLGINIGNGSIRLSSKKSETGLPAQLDYASVNKVYQAIKENYDGKLTASQMTDGLKHGLAEATNDPYTEYFTADEAKKFEGELNNSFSGIGAELGQDTDKNIIIIAPISGFPADKAGLKAQDIIASIDGKTTSGMSVDEAVSMIRGKKGTTVKLVVVRDKSQTLTFTITRDNIQVPSVDSKVLDNNIGYLHISSFSSDTAEQAEKQAADLKSKGVKGIILDMRDNPGGLLDAAIKVSSLWLPVGKDIVSEKGTIGDTDHRSTGNDILNGMPTVVLINKGTASAAEITAGALHDNKVATIIGEKSYGKGVVQQLINFDDGSELKVTVASWYRPNGANINHKGIDPDQTVTISDDDAKAGTDTQLQAAQDYLNR